MINKVVNHAKRRLKEPKLGLLSLSALVVGSIIGSGIFNLMKEMAVDSSPAAVIIAWVIAGIGMGTLVICFNNLSKRRPELNSGVYAYAKDGFGNYMGFNSAWGYWLSAWLGNVAYATMTFSALGYFFTVFGDGQNLVSVIGASVVLWAVTGLVLSGIKNASFMNIIVTLAKFIPLVIFIVALIFAFKLGIFTSDFWGTAMQNGQFQMNDLFKQVTGTMFATVFVFLGIEGASVYSGKAEHRKDVGRATVIGFLSIIAIYILLTVLSFGVMHASQLAGLQEPAMSYVLESIVGKWGAVLVNIGVIVSVLGAWLAWTLLAVEPIYQAAKGEVMPKIFAKENKHGVSTASVILTAVATQIFVLSFLISDKPYNLMYSLCASMILVPYLFVTLFQIKDSWKRERGSKGRGWNLFIGVLATVYAIWLMYAGGLKYLMAMVILYAIGIPLYMWARKGKEKRIFKPWELVVMILLIAVALYAVYWMIFQGGFTDLVG